jgi:glutamate dehydrogenase
MDGVETLRQSLEAVMSEFDRRNVDRKAKAFEDDGVPQDLARAVASADMLVSGCDVVRLAAQTGQSVNRVAEIYFAIGSHFALDWLREQAAALTAETHWQKMAVPAVVDDLFNHQITLARHVLRCVNGSGDQKDQVGASAIESWLDDRREPAGRTTRLLGDLKAADAIDLAMLAVANGQFRSLLAG